MAEVTDVVLLDYSGEGLLDLLGAVFLRERDRVGLVTEGRDYSYGDLWLRSDVVSAHLQDLGVVPGDLVGVRCGGTVDLVVSLLGILKAGAAYVPLDPSYPDARVRFMLEDSAVRVVLSDDTSSFGSAAMSGLEVQAVDVTSLPASRQGAAGQGAWGQAVRPVSGDYPAYVIYTSGSTGTPKGVVVPQRAVAALASDRVYLSLGPGDRVAQMSNTSFDAATFEIWSTLLSGATLVMMPREEILDPDRLPDALREQAIDSLFLTTALFNQIARRRPDGFSCLRDVLFGGEAVDPDCVALVLEAGGPSRLLNVYGPTENTTFSTWHETVVGAGENRTVPIGGPLSYVRCHVLDDHMRPVPHGAVGELYLGGAGLADGYLRRPALTAAQFVPDPFAERTGGPPGARLYRTGDLVRQSSSGGLEFVERRDSQIKLRGLRIELGEISAALMDHDEVLEAVAQALDAGQENARLVAYWVPADGSAVTVAMLRAHLAARLPSYAVPAALVHLERLPMTANGKIDHAALPLPTDEHLARTELQNAAPEAPLAEVIGHMWSNILEVERVLPEDDFFTLGGHSLLVTRVTSRLRQVLGVEVPVRTLFEAPTLAAFAARVEAVRRQAAGTQELALEPVPRSEPPALSYAQQRLWFIEQIAPLSPAYYISLALELRGPLQPAALAAALSDLCARHESLRTGFVVRDGEARQQIQLPRPISLDPQDLTARPEALAEELATFASLPFDLSSGEVLRAGLFTLETDRHVLAVSIHHIAADGWSLGILTRELSLFYQARCQGEAAQLAPLPIQYADFAVWQRRWLQGDALHRQQAYWRERLDGLPVLELPADHPRPAQLSYAGGSIRTEIDPELAGRLVALGRSHECTLYMVLLAAYQALLGHYAGQDDIVVGSPVAGRTRAEIEGLIGFFVNMLVMRTDLDGDPDFPTLLDRVREGTLEAYAHQDVPFELVVDDITSDRVANRHPLFQHHFALQTAPVSPLGFSELEVRPIGAEASWVRFDLECHLWHEEDGAIRGSWLYNTDLFEAGTIERFERHFCRLLDLWTQQPDLPLSRALAPPAEEQARICQTWGQHDTLRVTDSLPQRFTRTARVHPDRIALSTEREALSYEELDRRANQLAHLLIARGVGPEMRVGLAIGASPEQATDLLVGLLAILKAGGAYVPLDPAYPPERIAYMARDAQVQMILTRTGPEDAHPTDAQPGALDDFQIIDLAAPETRTQIDACSQDDPGLAISPDHAAYVIYTSGSTGQPKGVVVTHANVLRLMDTCQDRFAFGPDDVWTLFHSYAFDFSVWEIWGAWLQGGRLVTVPYQVSRDPRAFLELLEREAVTVLNQTPTAFYNLIGALPDNPPALPLRYVIFGGEALEPARLEAWFDHYGDTQPELVNMYGITETTVHVTWQTITAQTARKNALSPIGVPLPDLACHILDANMCPVDQNVPAEIYVAGAGLARGYLNKPALTAERFVPNPFATTPGERLYKTGDIASRDKDGNINYIRRADNQIQLRGFRIELGEIENIIAKNKNVQNVAVTTKTNNNITNINAFVVDKPETSDVEEKMLIDQWQTVYETTYETGSTEAVFDITGWKSSFSGTDIPEDQMREWLDATLARIRALQPKRVLEIGCGTGMILFDIAPHCDTYVGIDLSPTVIERLERVVEEQGLNNVVLKSATADSVADYTDQPFDLIIINSVIQYFPNQAYLDRVLQGAVSAISPGGSIFIGDVRSLPLLPGFHAAILCQNPDATIDKRKLSRQTIQNISAEEELVLDPRYFNDLARKETRISALGLTLKRGRGDNEMNRFRYDVCLHVDHPPASEPEHGMLELNGSNGTAWREEIKTNRPLAACVEGISNARTADAAAISAWLEDPYADPDLAVALAQLETSAFHPDDLIEWGEQLGYRVELFETPGAPGKMDAVLIGPECDADPAQLLPATRMDEMTPPDSPEISERSTDPLRPLRRRLLSEALRTTVRNTLPTHMHPSGYTFLDSLPRTPSGKLDHAALAMMEDSDAATLEAVNPVTPLESGLLEIWKDVLNIPHCGTTDSFFDLGGHSLSALQLISRIRSSYGVEYPLTVLFDSSSVQSAAKWIEPLLVQGDGAANDGAGIPETDAIRPAEEISVDELSDEEVEAMLLARLKQASDD